MKRNVKIILILGIALLITLCLISAIISKKQAERAVEEAFGFDEIERRAQLIASKIMLEKTRQDQISIAIDFVERAKDLHDKIKKEYPHEILDGGPHIKEMMETMLIGAILIDGDPYDRIPTSLEEYENLRKRYETIGDDP